MPTIQTAYDTFLLDCQARNLRPATLNVYRLQIGAFVAFCGDVGRFDLADIDTNLLRTYFVQQQARGLKPATVRSHARCLRAWLNFCASESFVNRSPFQHIRLPKEDHHKPDALTRDEVQRMIDAAQTQRNRAIIYCLLDTGCRLSEFAALRIGDVDLSSGAILLRRSTKNRADRTVFLGQRARAELAAYLAETPGLPPDAPLWRTDDNKHLQPIGLQTMLRRLGRRVGVHANAHKWRKTFALWSLRSGIDLFALQGLMGHSTIDMLKHYIGLSDEDLQRAHGLHSPVDHMLK